MLSMCFLQASLKLGMCDIGSYMSCHSNKLFSNKIKKKSTKLDCFKFSIDLQLVLLALFPYMA